MSTSAPAVSAKDTKHQAVAQRILVAFEQQACTAGPRGVAMAALARQLGISTRTLYRHFPTKVDMVTALMLRWADDRRARQQQGLSQELGPRERIMRATLDWLEHSKQFSRIFWQQLKRDFPDAHTIYQREQEDFRQRSRKNLSEDIRPDLHPDLALSALLALIAHASNEDLCAQLDLTRKAAVIQMIELWADGALRSPSQPAIQ